MAEHANPFNVYDDDVADPGHSPAVTAPEGGEYGLPFEASTHVPYAHEAGGWWGAATANQEYLNPSVGGEAGRSVGLGWTTGLRPRKEKRPPLDGRVLVVAPGQADNPLIGQVGSDNRANRLIAGVGALSTDYLPPLDDIARSFTQARKS